MYLDFSYNDSKITHHMQSIYYFQLFLSHLKKKITSHLACKFVYFRTLVPTEFCQAAIIPIVQHLTLLILIDPLVILRSHVPKSVLIAKIWSGQ